MNEEIVRLDVAPIVEAVVDIECDIRPQFKLLEFESTARSKFSSNYPDVKKRFVEQHEFQPRGEEPSGHTLRGEIHALQFAHADKTQLVQVRATGYSFNRLAPYTTLDDYFPEIEKTWKDFVEIASPIQVRLVRLRYINRFRVPLSDGKLRFTDYLTVGPQLPEQTNLNFTGFVNQYSALDAKTNARANVVLTALPMESDTKLPLIFDIGVEQDAVGSVADWEGIRSKINSLRILKNQIFHYTLTSRCKKLFESPQTL